MKMDLKQLEILSNSYGPTKVELDQFFVSENSVLTLAYFSFSNTLLNIKSKVEISSFETLKPENSGSKWPKTTIGCLINDQLPDSNSIRLLRQICGKYTSELKSLNKQYLQVPINAIYVVVFGCRSLGQRFFTIRIPLLGKEVKDDFSSTEHTEYVQKVMQQFSVSNHDKYYPLLDPNGKTWAKHYNNYHVETTLISEIILHERVMAIVSEFQDEVDLKLPGLYQWFDSTSWHLTLRALVPLQS